MNEIETPDYLELLDGLLHSDMVTDHAMSLSELDGFMAGIIACPVPVLPSEWIEHVWGTKGLNVESAEHGEAVNSLIMERFKQVLFGLYQGFVHPIYDIDDDDEMNWYNWAKGVSRAVALRPDAWAKFGSHDGGLGGEDAHEATASLLQFCAHANLDENQRQAARDIDEKTLEMATDLMPEAILLLYSVKQQRGIPIPVSLSDRAVKAVLSEPCPCGSGATYEDCCLPKDREKQMEDVKKAEAQT